MSNTNDFSTAKIGDRVYLRLNEWEGWCRVRLVYAEYLYIESESMVDSIQRMVNKNGSLSAIKQIPQCLFWDKPEIIAPERPKRLVKKVVKVRPWKDSYGIVRLASGTLLIEHEESPLNCGPEQEIEVKVWEE